MKYYILFLFPLFSLSTALAQDDRAAIRKHLDQYLAYTHSKDMDGVLDYLYPRVFELAPREQLRKAMMESFADTTMSLNFKNVGIDKVSSVLAVDEVKYALVDYHFTMSLKLLQEMDDAGLDFMLGIFKAKYGKKGVTMDRATQTILIDVTAEAYAINDPQYAGWKFLEKKDQYKNMVETWLPKRVLKKLK